MDSRTATKHVDNSLAAQRAKVLSMLRIRPRHTYSLRDEGISHPAARVRELVAAGYGISAGRITCADAAGYLHRGVAIYELVSEPTAADAHSPAH